jgi:hypothetical protein
MAQSRDQIFARSGVVADGHDAFPHDAVRLTEKVDGILASPAFLRAPILSRLLRYLLDRTIAGEADNLKAYTIAVDGLDRSPDFDAQFDSYPRVQMVRLRKALETFYLENSTLPQPFVYLGAGSYRLQLGMRDVAYPNGSGLLRVTRPAIQGLAALPNAVGRHFSARGMTIVFWVMAVGLIGLALSLVHGFRTVRTPVRAAPIIEIGFRDTAASEASSDIIDAFTEGFSRSWVTQVRDTSAGSGPASSKPSYRLVLRDGDGRLDAKLIDAKTNMVLWTDSAAGDGRDDPRKRLAPMIAKLVGPFGFVARTETSRLTPETTGSFACILRYFAFVKARDAQEEARVAKCLEQPVSEPQLGATTAAVRSFFALESGTIPDREAALVAAERFARMGTDADAEDPYTHYAKARLAFLRSDCDAGLFYADRAVSANPYDSVIVTIMAGLATPCSAEKAKQFLDQAYRIRNDNDVTMRSSLIFATIAQGQETRLDELGFLLRPPAGPQLPGYLLTESILKAVRGQTKEARGLWSELQALRPNAASDDERLKTVILSDWMRKRVLDLMRARGVTVS